MKDEGEGVPQNLGVLSFVPRLPAPPLRPPREGRGACLALLQRPSGEGCVGIPLKKLPTDETTKFVLSVLKIDTICLPDNELCSLFIGALKEKQLSVLAFWR